MNKTARVTVAQRRYSDGLIDYRVVIEGEPLHILKVICQLGDLELDSYDYQDWKPHSCKESTKND